MRCHKKNMWISSTRNYMDSTKGVWSYHGKIERELAFGMWNLWKGANFYWKGRWFFYWTICDVCEFILEGFYSFTSKLEGNCNMCGSVHGLRWLYWEHVVLMVGLWGYNESMQVVPMVLMVRFIMRACGSMVGLQSYI
jgi:hypothetical protein